MSASETPITQATVAQQQRYVTYMLGLSTGALKKLWINFHDFVSQTLRQVKPVKPVRLSQVN